MNWITNFVKPKIKALISKEIPDDLWNKCVGCEKTIFHRVLKDNLYVCPECNYHNQISAIQRLAIIFNNTSYKEILLPEVNHDLIKFKDIKKYSDRLKAAQQRTKSQDALRIGYGTIGHQPVVCAVLDFNFMGGSMGRAVGDGIVMAVAEAINNKAALIIVTASGGARMQEGIISLMQMTKTTIAINKLKSIGLPYIVLLTNPTTGGVTASFAMLGDIHLAEPGATICFSGRRIIAQTINTELPLDFQTAEYLLNKGMLDQIVQRCDLNNKIGNILTILNRPNNKI